MKQFSFKLQSLLNWREAQYEQAELKYAQALRFKQKAEEALRAAEAALGDFQENEKKLRQAPQVALKSQQSVIFLQKLMTDVRIAQEAFQEANKIVEVLLNEMLNKKIALSAMEKLYQKKAKNYIFEEMRREEKEIEDIVARKFS